MRREVKSQNVVVDLVGVLVEAAKGVNLTVPAVRDGGIDEARRPGPHGTSDLWPIAIRYPHVPKWRVRHYVGAI